jgi:TatA/E family protein of Tat protein translocase
MFGFHPQDLIVVLIIALLIFGPKKLPEMGSAIGKSIKEFRKGMNEIASPDSNKANLAVPKESVEETRMPSMKDLSNAIIDTTMGNKIVDSKIVDSTPLGNNVVDSKVVDSTPLATGAVTETSAE